MKRFDLLEFFINFIINAICGVTLYFLLSPYLFAQDLPADSPEVPAKVVAKARPKEDTLRVEKVSRPLSDQAVKRDQLLAYLSSKQSFAAGRGCVVDGFLTCQGQGARIEGSPAAMDEGRYRPRPGTIRGYHE
ncbi:hypothetical protein ACIPF8_17465 [Collimonas sp. NPDC087041]|uniref:hypothetical protein n=1 Tax=Collimonas sp. NPDC087041 TaxID=3363960 RepID=UPI003803CC27